MKWEKSETVFDKCKKRKSIYETIVDLKDERQKSKKQKTKNKKVQSTISENCWLEVREKMKLYRRKKEWLKYWAKSEWLKR